MFLAVGRQLLNIFGTWSYSWFRCWLEAFSYTPFSVPLFQDALAEAILSVPLFATHRHRSFLVTRVLPTHIDQPCHKSMWAIDYFYGAFQAAQADFLTIHGPCERETLIKAFQKFSGSTGI